MADRRQTPYTLHEATLAAPTLAHLAALARESADRLRAIEPLIPAALRSSIRPGPIEDTTWCLLVQGNAAAAKLRQLLPVLVKGLRDRGWEITTIRLRVQTRAG